MGRSKQAKFEDNAQRRNVVEPGKPILDKIRGNWNALHFKNDNPIVLELACGRGEYSVGLGRIFPDKNFIGVDIKGARIWRGSKIAVEEQLDNVAFLRIHIQNLEQYFAESEVSEIWITFPDPRPKGSDERRRLTHPRFLMIYRNILKTPAWVHLKTDNTALLEYSLETIRSEEFIGHYEYTFDLYNSPLSGHHHDIQTTYEKTYLENNTPIKYLRFQIK